MSSDILLVVALAWLLLSKPPPASSPPPTWTPDWNRGFGDDGRPQDGVSLP